MKKLVLLFALVFSMGAFAQGPTTQGPHHEIDTLLIIQPCDALSNVDYYTVRHVIRHDTVPSDLQDYIQNFLCTTGKFPSTAYMITVHYKKPVIFFPTRLPELELFDPIIDIPVNPIFY